MAKTFPKDRFDVVPDDLERVGAHRAPKRRGRAWIWVAWCALAVVILVGAGVIGLFAINGTLNFKDLGTNSSSPSVSSTPTPTIVPSINPTLEVTVLNGTTKTGLATEVAAKLTKAGWQKVTTANASQTNITQTTVFYSDDANQGAAQAMANELPGAIIEKTQDYVETGAALTVVVGSDYKG